MSDFTQKIRLSPTALWDERGGFFYVLFDGNETFAALAISPDAPLPLTHLDMSEHQRATPLGPNLVDRLEAEVSAAIGRGAHQVATGLSLLTHEELKDIT